MPRDISRPHRLEQLQRDGAALDSIGTRIDGLADFIRLTARECEGRQTADALEKLAQALRDTAHDAFGDAVEMHSRDCDEENVAPYYTIDAALAVAFGLPLPEGAPLTLGAGRV